MCTLKVKDVITPTRAELQTYLDKGYVFESGSTAQIHKDITFKYPYRYISSNGCNDRMEGVWSNKSWKVVKSPIITLSFKDLL